MKTLIALLSCIGAAVAGLTTVSSQAATLTEHPVIWAVGDLCDSEGGCTDVADLIRGDAQTDGVALAGDVAYDNGSRSDFERFHLLFGSRKFPDGTTLKSKALPAPGNHEYRDGAITSPCPYYFTYFGTKAGSCTGTNATGSQPWRSRLFPAGATASTPGAWRVLMVNSNYAAEPAGASCNAWCMNGGGSTRYSWGLTATQVLQQRSWLAAQCKAADVNAQGAIVVFHHPALTDGKYGPGTRLGRDLFSVAAANGCEIVLVGHDHLYERFTPRSATGAAAVGGATQFLVGTGGHSPTAPTSDTAASQYVGSGALRLVLTPTGADFQYRSTDGVVRDSGRVPLT